MGLHVKEFLMLGIVNNPEILCKTDVMYMNHKQMNDMLVHITGAAVRQQLPFDSYCDLMEWAREEYRKQSMQSR